MGKTEVLVDEGLTTASYLLDETLIAFGTATYMFVVNSATPDLQHSIGSIVLQYNSSC
jgi:hypothetical protein